MQSEGLPALKVVFVGLMTSGFVIAGIAFLINPGIGRIGLPVAALVMAASLTGAAAGHWVMRRPLKTGSAETLAQSYKTNLFLAYAINEAPLLVAFALTFFTEAAWPILIALPLWLVGCSLIAPTSGNLAKREELRDLRNG